MNTNDKILSLKETTKAKIELALKNNNTGILIAAAKDLDLLERLEKQYKEIETTISSMSQEGIHHTITSQNIYESYKELGKRERKIFIEEAKKRNIILTPEKRTLGPLYRNESGGLVGITYASERNSNRWFLGLPKKEYSSIVFICKNNRLKVTYFILPRYICEKYQNEFYMDEKETQYKFNISLKKDEQHLLTMPSTSIELNDYIDKFDNIKILEKQESRVLCQYRREKNSI